jgi:uncharacterized protein (DUF1684 family)
MTRPPQLDLLDWKRQIFDLYRRVREVSDPKEGWEVWRSTRDALFKNHSQSPIPVDERASFSGLPTYDYDPAARVTALVEPTAPVSFEIDTSGEIPMKFKRFGRVSFELFDREVSLELFWVETYGGGIFLPFRDGTSGKETYGAGRYLLDTVKGADLGNDGDHLILDFNFAFNPSCSYDPRWVCPLAPPSNRLSIEVRAGEVLLEET